MQGPPSSPASSWRPLDISLHPLPPSSWLPEAEAGLQDPALFLQAEAAMAGEELVWEVN